MSRSSFFLSCLALVASVSTGLGDDNDDTQLLERFIAIWDGQRSEIITCQMTYRHIATARNIQPLSPDETAERVSHARLDLDADNIRALLKALLTQPPNGDPPWEVATLLWDGDRVRMDANSNLQGQRSHIRDEHDVIVTRNNGRQADLHLAGESRTFQATLDLLRPLPPRKPVDQFSILAKTPTEITVLHGARRMQVDRASGFVRHFRLTTASGKIAKDIFVGGAAIDPTGITMPKYSFYADYRDERLVAFRVCMVESFLLNTSIPREAFQLAMLGNSKAIDYRENPKAPAYIPIDHPTDDVLAYANDYVAERKASHKSSGPLQSSIPSIVAMTMLVIAIVVGIWIRKCAKHPRNSHI